MFLHSLLIQKKMFLLNIKKKKKFKMYNTKTITKTNKPHQCTSDKIDCNQSHISKKGRDSLALKGSYLWVKGFT